MDIGRRVIYDQDGDIIADLGEMTGDVLPRKEITELHFVDLTFGSFDPATHKLIKIDTATNQPILEEIVVPLTPEQLRIKELEEQLAQYQTQTP